MSTIVPEVVDRVVASIAEIDPDKLNDPGALTTTTRPDVCVGPCAAAATHSWAESKPFLTSWRVWLRTLTSPATPMSYSH